MAKRYEYDKYIQKMLSDFEVTTKSIEGEAKNLVNPWADPSHMQNFTDWVDPWNPLWSDEQYAKTTKWGGIIAPPFFMDCAVTMTFFPVIDPAGGFLNHNLYGENWDIYGQVRPGDRYRIVRSRPTLDEITAEDGSDEFHTFSFVPNHSFVYNQQNELLAEYKMLMDVSIWPGGSKKDDLSSRQAFKVHCYGKEEQEYVQEIMNNEVIRGAEKRYWEDVRIGDRLVPVTIGPTSVWDMVSFAAARKELPFSPLRVFREHPGSGPVLQDQETGVFHMGPEWHIDDAQAALMGDPKAFCFSASSRAHMARIVTNWMGDDGEIIHMDWRHLKRTPIGDCQIAHGIVVGKRVDEQGRTIADLEVWLDNVCRGNVSEAAAVSVILPAREAHVPGTGKRAPENKLPNLGERVRICGMFTDYPGGNPLVGSEGVVTTLYPWREPFEKFKNYLAIQIDRPSAQLTIGDTLVFRGENLASV